MNAPPVPLDKFRQQSLSKLARTSIPIEYVGSVLGIQYYKQYSEMIV